MWLDSGLDNAVRGNAIHDNSGLGIDLAPGGVTPNDELDKDSGANKLQNYPVLASADSDGATTTVEGTLQSTSSTTFTLDFYASASCDPSGYGEGAVYLGAAEVTTDTNGNASFSAHVPVAVGEGQAVTATATNPDGSTSEFSACVTATATIAMPEAYDWHYTYDGLGRLTYACSQWDAATETCPGDAFSYAYDGAGNLLTLARWDAVSGQVETVSYLYNGANQIQCLDADLSGACDGAETLWQYDAYGNLLDDGVQTYTYDAALRLVSVSDGTSTTTYAYNGDGDRVSQAVDGVTTTYLLDVATPLTMVLAEQTGTDPAIFYLHGLDLVAQSDGAATEYFAYDGLSSVRQMVDATGSPLLTQSFDPYGSLYARAGEGVTSFGFTGEYGDSNGLLYLRARYYAPSQGRFFQLDPGRIEGNPYAYVAGNPISRVDPSGLCWNNPNASPTERAICIAAWEQRYGPSSNYEAQYWGILSYQDFKLRWNRGVGTGSAGTSTAWMSALATCAFVEPTPFGEVIVGLSMVTLWFVEHAVPPPDLHFDFSIAEYRYGVGSAFSTHASEVSVPRDRAFEAQNPQLEKWVRELYPPGALVGSGSAADALCEEAETGQPIGGSWHAQKTREIAERLERWIEAKTRGYIYNEQAELLDDIELAEELLEDLKDALEKWNESPYSSQSQEGGRGK